MPEAPRSSGRRIAVLGAAALALTATALGCSGSDGASSATAASVEAGTTATTVPEAVPAEQLCAASLQPGGTVASPALVETSGLAASRRHPDVLWAHNDSGSGPEVHALGLDGADLGTVEVTGAEALDWEDMALLAGPTGDDRLVLADVGDNPGGGARTTTPARLWIVAEPDLPGPAAAATSTSEAVGVAISYSDGPRDAETLLADPLTGDLFVISKQWDGEAAGAYRVPAAALEGGSTSPVVMDRTGSVGGTDGALVTGGDVSADGRVVVLRTYDGVRIWDRDPAATVPEALAAEPRCVLPVRERQGEAVAVLADGAGFVTVSEGAGVAVNVHRAP